MFRQPTRKELELKRQLLQRMTAKGRRHFIWVYGPLHGALYGTTQFLFLSATDKTNPTGHTAPLLGLMALLGAVSGSLMGILIAPVFWRSMQKLLRSVEEDLLEKAQ